MSHVSDRVGTCRQGATKALAGSGSSSMSLSVIAGKPRIEEPSKPSPTEKTLSVSSFNGIEKCCQVPGRSVNFTSTTCTPASLARRITSAADGAAAAFAPVVTVGSNVAVIRSVSSLGGGRRSENEEPGAWARGAGLWTQLTVGIRQGMGHTARCQGFRARTAGKLAQGATDTAISVTMMSET